MIVNEYELRDAIRAIDWRRRQEPERKHERCFAGAVKPDGTETLHLEHNAQTHEFKISTPASRAWWKPYVLIALSIVAGGAGLVAVICLAILVAGALT
jgi:hypothetical protein